MTTNDNFSAANIENAVFETIYWWDRQDDFYHRSFVRLLVQEVATFESDEFAFFIDKVFKKFLSDYSVRRNIAGEAKHSDSVKSFIDALKENDFFTDVMDGKTDVIDRVSNVLKEGELTNNKHCTSLLSKIAALINPGKFILVDTLTRRALKKVSKNVGVKASKLEIYSNYLECAKKALEASSQFKPCAMGTLKKLPNRGSGYHYFYNNEDAFQLKVLDKLLWIIDTKRDSGKELDNKGFVEFSKIID